MWIAVDDIAVTLSDATTACFSGIKHPKQGEAVLPCLSHNTNRHSSSVKYPLGRGGYSKYLPEHAQKSIIASWVRQARGRRHNHRLVPTGGNSSVQHAEMSETPPERQQVPREGRPRKQGA